MYKYTRKYYINGKETTLDIVLKYIEIKLTHDDLPLDALNITFNTKLLKFIWLKMNVII